MKGLAFAYDPDGYWVEIVKRADTGCDGWDEFNLSQTMLRVKDPVKSIKFYTEKLGMTLLRESHYSDFSLYFLASLQPDGDKPPEATSNESSEYIKKLFNPVLELTHNHGTETREDFVHLNGNAPADKKGFGHIGFLVDVSFSFWVMRVYVHAFLLTSLYNI